MNEYSDPPASAVPFSPGGDLGGEWAANLLSPATPHFLAVQAPGEPGLAY